MPPQASVRRLVAALVISLAGLASLPAAAQQADMRMQGTIEKLDAKSLVVRRKDGTTSVVSVDAGTAVFTNQPSSLSAIKPGDYVASAAVEGADGKLRSKDLRIFPEALRGIGEGQRPMDEPKTLMTNASVAEVVAAPEG
jgi:Cu/Ag efflux protein CusF